ncbi:DUF1648 domain-containing protein [Bacillus manliponensis]|uniref:DUF1648 domain-containing protein n=1 Tax=Bacillus manliponensis TaxID=574376 RepID=UPI00351237FC
MKAYKYIIFISSVMSIFAYPYLSDIIAIHWRLNGKADEFVNKQAVFMLPILLLFIHSIFLFAEQYIYKMQGDGKRMIRNMESIILLFLLYIHSILILIGIGVSLHFQSWLTVGIGLFLFLLSKCFKRIGAEEAEPKMLRKIRLYSKYTFRVMAIAVIICLPLQNEVSFYALITIMSCGAVIFMSCVLYEYILESYKT